MTRPATVRTELELGLVVPGGPSLPVVSVLRYEADDPWAVRVAFQTGGDGPGVIEWLFARNLLIDGTAGPVGEGDVRVWPAAASSGGEDVVHIALSSPDGQALLEAPASTLTDFLLRTYAVVPRGGETSHLDIDAALASLLSD